MDQITIRTHIPLARAIGAGKSQYGEARVALDDAHVASLSEGARAILETVVERDQRLALDAPEATPEAVVEALKALESAKREADEAKRAALSAATEEALARGDDAWIHDGTPAAWAWGTARLRVEAPALTTIDESDPRVIARLARLRAEVLPGLVAAHAAWRAERARATREVEAQREAEAQRAEAQREAAREAATQWAIARLPEYADAATEGYDVVGPVARSLADALVGAQPTEPIGDASRTRWLVEGSKAFDRFGYQDRRAPVRSWVEAQRHLVEVAAKAELPAGWSWSVERVARVTWHQPEDAYGEAPPEHWTGLVAELCAPGQPTRYLVIRLDR